MKFILSIIILLTAMQTYGQAVAAMPLAGSDFYQTLSLNDHIGKIKKIKNSDNLLRETFKQRYAPKSIKTDADILRRISRYKTNPTMKAQDLGWLFETYVKNKYDGFNYVKKSTAWRNDLTGKLADGRFTNAQLKTHKSGNPKTYFKEMKNGYNALFIIPDDHVENLKAYIKKEIIKKRQRGLDTAQLESMLNRIKPSGINYAGLEKLSIKGVNQIINENPAILKELSPAELSGLEAYAATPTSKLSNATETAIRKYKINPKYLARAENTIGIVTICYLAYESYSIYKKYDSGNISKMEMYKSYSNLTFETVGALAGAKIGSVIGAKIGAFSANPVVATVCVFIGGVAGGITGAIIGSKTSDYIFDPYVYDFDKNQKYRYEKGINESLGYNGYHPALN